MYICDFFLVTSSLLDLEVIELAIEECGTASEQEKYGMLYRCLSDTCSYLSLLREVIRLFRSLMHSGMITPNPLYCNRLSLAFRDLCIIMIARNFYC